MPHCALTFKRKIMKIGSLKHQIQLYKEIVSRFIIYCVRLFLNGKRELAERQIYKRHYTSIKIRSYKRFKRENCTEVLLYQ